MATTERSDIDATRPPHVTESARALLAGRPVTIRASRRNGCCGGVAMVPIAEPGVPEQLDAVECFEVSGTEVYVERGLLGADASCTIDTDGFFRWRRLVVLDVNQSTSGSQPVRP